LRFEFSRHDLDHIALINGYAKDEPTFQRNLRIKDVRVVTDGNRAVRRRLKDTMDSQDVSGPFGPTSSVKLEILSVYRPDPGDFREAALTEVEFFE
jgi:hypothetical protein